MATTSYLYHALGLQGYDLLRTEYDGGEVSFHVKRKGTKRRCRQCGARWHQLALAGQYERWFRGLPLGARRQFVVLHGHRQACGECGATAREPVPFADGKSRYLKVFARYAVSLCKLMTIKSVARLLGVGWDLIKQIHKTHLEDRLRKRRLRDVRYIAVDEFSIHKGHKYMTIVLDLETGVIIHAQEGKDAQALSGFLRRLRRSRARLKAVAMDMSAAYRNAVREVFGERVDIVYDRFHVVSLVNEALDETRRDIVRDLGGSAGSGLKKTRFVLLKALENLSQQAHERLIELSALNEPLFKAYILKEHLRHLWEQPDAKRGGAFLDAWIEEARALDNPHFARVATTLQQRRHGLLAYFEHRITSGPIEGTNNKIKVLKRQAYGFRDMAYFKLRLYFLHRANTQLVG
jgi:transposase